MFHHPNRFASDHRIVLFHQGSQPDFERLEDLTADAIRAARLGTECLAELPHDLTKPLRTYIKILADAVGNQRVLSDDFRHAAGSVLGALDSADTTGGVPARVELATRHLHDALAISHRVSDLLAAERDIGWHRAKAR